MKCILMSFLPVLFVLPSSSFADLKSQLTPFTGKKRLSCVYGVASQRAYKKSLFEGEIDPQIEVNFKTVFNNPCLELEQSNISKKTLFCHDSAGRKVLRERGGLPGVFGDKGTSVDKITVQKDGNIKLESRWKYNARILGIPVNSDNSSTEIKLAKPDKDGAIKIEVKEGTGVKITCTSNPVVQTEASSFSETKLQGLKN